MRHGGRIAEENPARRTDADTGQLGSPRRSCRRGAARPRRSTQVLPLLYLHGLSTGDFVPALGQFLGSSAGLSAPVITKLTETWKAEQRAFAARDLSGVDYVYLWADGIHVNIRLEEHNCACWYHRRTRRRPQGARRAGRWLPRVGRVLGGSAA